MSKHTPNDCICGGKPNKERWRVVKEYQIICWDCGRHGLKTKDENKAIADWNLQTAAPIMLDLLEILRGGTALLPKSTIDIIELALAKAEPKL